MRKILFGLVVCVGILSARAQASVCVIPNTITNGNIVDATPVQQNFNALVSCANNIDWQNIDATGIYASQIIPTTPGQATFGGNVTYTFTQHVNFVQSITVDSTASPPSSGIAGGTPSLGFLLTSNAGATANQGFKFITAATSLPSSAPLVQFNYGGTLLFKVNLVGDGVFNGGVAIDGAAPDGSSLIGGQGTTPFFLISQNGSGAASNFAFKDAHDNIPAVFWENSSGTAIFELDGIGDGQFGGSLGVDNATPPPHGIAGGTGAQPFGVFSNTTGAAYAFTFTDKGTNTNIARFINGSAATVHVIDETGGESIGASAQTVIEPTSASFGGAVGVPTAGANNSVCTDGSKNLIACPNGGSALSVYNGSSTPIANPIAEYGTTVVTISGTGGPNGGTSGSTVQNLPVSMSNSGYAVTVVPDTNWVLFNVTGKSTSQFTINAGNPWPPGNQTVTFTWMAIGH